MFPGQSREPDGPDLGASHGDDLAWDAFRYVTNAMPPRDVAAFEQRLGRDQAARAAVAGAVDLLGAVQVVARQVAGNSQDVVPLRVNPKRRSGIAAGATTAAAAVAILLAVFWGSSRFLGPSSIGDPTDVPLAWTHLRGEESGADGSPAFNEPAPVDPVGVPDSAPDDGGSAEAVDASPERPLPSWLVAAVSPIPAATFPRPEDN